LKKVGIFFSNFVALSENMNFTYYLLNCNLGPVSMVQTVAGLPPNNSYLAALKMANERAAKTVPQMHIVHFSDKNLSDFGPNLTAQTELKLKSRLAFGLNAHH
jgi:hypothetical protein